MSMLRCVESALSSVSGDISEGSRSEVLCSPLSTSVVSSKPPKSKKSALPHSVAVETSKAESVDPKSKFKSGEDIGVVRLAFPVGEVGLGRGNKLRRFSGVIGC